MNELIVRVFAAIVITVICAITVVRVVNTLDEGLTTRAQISTRALQTENAELRLALDFLQRQPK